MLILILNRSTSSIFASGSCRHFLAMPSPSSPLAILSFNSRSNRRKYTSLLLLISLAVFELLIPGTYLKIGTKSCKDPSGDLILDSPSSTSTISSSNPFSAGRRAP